MSFMKRKRNAVTIETKLEIIDQLHKTVSGSSLAARYNIDIIIQLSEKIDYPNQPLSQLVWIIGVLLYSRFRLIGPPVNRVSRLIGPNC